MFHVMLCSYCIFVLFFGSSEITLPMTPVSASFFVISLNAPLRDWSLILYWPPASQLLLPVR